MLRIILSLLIGAASLPVAAKMVRSQKEITLIGFVEKDPSKKVIIVNSGNFIYHLDAGPVFLQNQAALKGMIPTRQVILKVLPSQILSKKRIGSSLKNGGFK